MTAGASTIELQRTDGLDVPRAKLYRNAEKVEHICFNYNFTDAVNAACFCHTKGISYTHDCSTFTCLRDLSVRLLVKLETSETTRDDEASKG